MARLAKRFAHSSMRSASSPAHICAHGTSTSSTSAEEGAINPQEATAQDSPNSVAAESRLPRARSREKASTKHAGATPLGSRSPPTRYNMLPSSFLDRATSKDQTPTSLALELPSDDDFVEGGVELSPTKERRDDEHSGDEGNSPLPTRTLSQLGQQELQELWPRQPGQSNALFLDYDGTLREFEARPELAVPSPELMKLLTEIDAREDLVPHIISGRNQEFLQEHFGRLTRFTLIAEHGFQISTAPATSSGQPEDKLKPEDNGRKWQLWEHYGGNVRFFKDHENWKAIMRAEISRLVRETPGSHLEEKRSSLVWHYREVPDDARGEAAALRAVQELEMLRDKEKIQDVKVTQGHKVVEVSYRNVRKGLVMRRLCEEKALFGEPYGGVLVAGDDVSDETMFDAAPCDFLTIKVGLGSTLARFRAQSPSELRQFLRTIVS
eukprot:CAMPEP_0195069962 /NCGR_PEP_ID=MMETSP0448-20130528/14136_1 /TAXON_ID=66468 /ORGANISM="Heterocapsa triquestra, Strain CCMP 448" /LENGTH=438 /DNA_ID=CAMNT_0040101623 /DNA_START=76 /DNA_END=1392 /DNA_ORIENTATION=-